MTDCVAVVVVDAANIRSQPRAGTSIVGIARMNEQLPVLEAAPPDTQNFPWLRVRLPNMTTGWVRGDLVQVKGDCATFGILSITPSTSDTAPITTPAAATSEAIVLPGDCKGQVNVARANVRVAPVKGAAVVGFLVKNTAFIIEEISPEDADGFNWYKLDMQGQPGWVREDLVTISGDCHDAMAHAERPIMMPPPTQETAPPGQAPSTTGCVAMIGPQTANVRAQPSTSAKSLGQAPKNTPYKVKEVTDAQADGFTWIEIDFNGQSGFVRSDLAMLQGDCVAFTNDDRLPQPVAVRITQGYRPANNPQHFGLDFGSPEGSELRMAIPAKVVRAHFCDNCTGKPPNIVPSTNEQRQQIFRDPRWGWGYGHHVIVSHDFKDLPATTRSHILNMGGNDQWKVFVLYAHLSRMDVQVNQTLPAGSRIGLTGNTGNSTAQHLHMEVAFGTKWDSAKKVHPAMLFAIPSL